eukprot:5475009-Ditylum_brightwellii.AAC.1
MEGWSRPTKSKAKGVIPQEALQCSCGQRMVKHVMWYATKETRTCSQDSKLQLQDNPVYAIDWMTCVARSMQPEQGCLQKQKTYHIGMMTSQPHNKGWDAGLTEEDNSSEDALVYTSLGVGWERCAFVISSLMPYSGALVRNSAKGLKAEI